jgi:acyl-CoA thioesterase-2
VTETQQFFGLERVDDDRWQFPVTEQLCSGLGALFGGCGLGAALEALEQTTGRPTVWATAQYLSFASPDQIVNLEINEVARGRYTSQARVLARVGGKEIFTVLASLGERDVRVEGEWISPPVVPAPMDCPPRPVYPDSKGRLMEHIEARLADARLPTELDGRPGGGHSALWIRFPDLPVTSAALAIVGDFVPFGISQALGSRIGGNSLDNTLRVYDRHPTEWILAAVEIHRVVHGFGHGLVHLWSEAGELLGSASQSVIVREAGNEMSAVRRNQAENKG